MYKRLLSAVALFSFVSALPLETVALTRSAVSDGVLLPANRIAACRDANTKVGGLKVDILFVIDTSQSLRVSDPIGKKDEDPARVRAMESVISMLQRDAEAGKENKNVQIRVNFLDFGSRVRPSFGDGQWQSIDGFVPSDLKNFATKDDDFDTDYVGALIDRGGVIDVLSQSRNQSDCQVVLWFTDGKFEFEKKPVRSRKFDWLEAEIGNGEVKDRATAERAAEVGENLLCGQGESRNSSVADELRLLDNKGSLTVLGIGLNTSGDASNFAILRKLLEGPDCGTKDPVGYLVEVRSVDDLADAMRKSIFGGVSVKTVCNYQKENGNTFFIAEPVESADIFLRSRGNVEKIELIQVDDDQKTLATIPIFEGGNVGSGDSITGVTVEIQKLDDAPTLEIKIEFDAPTDKWVGQWAIQACDENGFPAAISADVLIRGCIAFDLAEGDEEIIVGREKKIFLALKRCGSYASRLSTVEAVSLNAIVRIGDVKVETVLGPDESYIEIPFAPTESDLAGAKTKKVKLEVLEVDASYEVLEGERPVVLEWSKENSVFDITLRRPPSTPFVEKPVCGVLKKGSDSVTCEFAAKANEAVGQVATAGPQIKILESLGATKFVSNSSSRFPLKVVPGEPKQFSFTFTLDGTRTNLQEVFQTFTIDFEYETDGEPVDKERLEGSFLVEPDFRVTPDWWRAVRFAALGLLAALSILVLARFIFARIQVPEGGLIWITAVELDRLDTQTARASLLGSSVSATSFPVPPSALGPRQIKISGSLSASNSTLRARAGWRIMSELGFIEVSSEIGSVIASGGVVGCSGKGRISLNLTKEWWIISSWQGDGSSESKESLVTEIMASPSRVVFVAVGAQSPRGYLEDVARGIDNSLEDQLSQLADCRWKKPQKGEENSEGSKLGLPEI